MVARNKPTDLAYWEKHFCGHHIWVRGYLVVSSGTITYEMIEEFLAKQEVEPVVDDSRFLIELF
jgi:REP element-mobilizing transposase RayT